MSGLESLQRAVFIFSKQFLYPTVSGHETVALDAADLIPRRGSTAARGLAGFLFQASHQTYVNR